MVPILMIILIAALSYFFFTKYVAPSLGGDYAHDPVKLWDQLLKSASTCSIQPARSLMDTQPARSVMTAKPAQSTTTARLAPSHVSNISTKVAADAQSPSSTEMPVSVGVLQATAAASPRINSVPESQKKNTDEPSSTMTAPIEPVKIAEDAPPKESVADEKLSALVPYPDQEGPESNVPSSVSSPVAAVSAVPSSSVPEVPPSNTTSLPIAQPSSNVSDAPPQKKSKKKKSQRDKKSKGGEKKKKKHASKGSKTSEDKDGEKKKKSHTKKKKKHKSKRDKSAASTSPKDEERSPTK